MPKTTDTREPTQKDYGAMSQRERTEDLWDQLAAARRAISTLQDTVLDLTEITGQLVEQRDALLAACEAACSVIPDRNPVKQQVLAAIVKARGQKEGE